MESHAAEHIKRIKITPEPFQTSNNSTRCNNNIFDARLDVNEHEWRYE